MRKILLALLLLAGISHAKTNVSMAKTLFSFQNNEYNLIIAPKHIVISGKKKKTRQAIKKGFHRTILNLIREVKIRDINLHPKLFIQGGSNIKQYREKDESAFELLQKMIQIQVELREEIFDDEIKQSNKKESLDKAVSADDIGMDDLDDSAFDISEDKVAINNSVKSPRDAFVSMFVEMSELYNNEVLELSKALHPFMVNGKPKLLPVHSVFGVSFFPTKYGSIKLMKMYVVMANINSEKEQSVQIIAKLVPNFKWDRNYLYISAATGRILRQIVSSVTAESFTFGF